MECFAVTESSIMGMYFNPGNNGFRRIIKSEYVDKTGMIGLINAKIDTTENLLCVSRPRRFGKSFAAQMLCAYYDFSCNSHELFDSLAASKMPDYTQHLNQYHVIYLDITGFISRVKQRKGNLGEVPLHISQAIEAELKTCYPSLSGEAPLLTCLKDCVNLTKRKFIFIIDEWDSMIREAKRDWSAQERYLNLLREWFKNGNFTADVVAAAYMTGILPIKKDGKQSAISDFHEFTFLDPGIFTDYTGFTESEVEDLCKKSDMDMNDIKAWYDGYTFDRTESIYNPYSLICAMRSKKLRSYWKKTSASEALQTYIDMDFEGLQEDIVMLIAGEAIQVDTDGFENDFESFRSKEDVLTLLIHLGYLTFDETSGLARIPNEELRIEFRQILRKDKHGKLMELVRESDRLLEDTLAGDEKAVAEAISKVQASSYAPMFYNNEQSLRAVVKSAYVTCVDYYMKVEELPTGRGIADIVYLPKKESSLPALVVELKWNRSAESAIAQIKEKNYPAVLKGYVGEILLVGIRYYVKTKNHSCRIEKIYPVP